MMERAPPEPVLTVAIKFQNAMSAALAMVPDGGPWIIHTDLHTKNVLVSRTEPGKYMLHDWGRTIVIASPIEKSTVVAGVREYMRVFATSMRMGIFQWPDKIVQAIQAIYRSSDTTEEQAILLRVWTIFVIFKHIVLYSIPSPTAETKYTPSEQQDVMKQILQYLLNNGKTHATLRTAINRIMTSLTHPPGTAVQPYILSP